MPLDLAMILTRTPVRTLDPKRFQTAFASLFSQAPVQALRLSGNLLECTCQGLEITISPMPAPIPWSDLEGPSATSLLWPDAAPVAKAHRGHLIVVVRQEADDRLLFHRVLTMATAAALQAVPEAEGVLWCPSQALAGKGVFVELAQQVLPTGPPLMLWVDVRAGPADKGLVAGFTTGLAALGHREIETSTATDTVGAFRERVWALAGYLVEHGPVIRAGHTVGRSAREHIEVEIGPSSFGHPGEVLRLVYGPPAPWWKFW